MRSHIANLYLPSSDFLRRRYAQLTKHLCGFVNAACYFCESRFRRWRDVKNTFRQFMSNNDTNCLPFFQCFPKIVNQTAALRPQQVYACGSGAKVQLEEPRNIASVPKPL